MTRLFQHAVALLILVAILILNGCAPMTFPTAPSGGSAAPAAEAPAAEAPAASGEAEAGSSAYEAPARPAESSTSSSADATMPSQSGQYQPVTAGVTDDNERWNDYLDYLNRHAYDLNVHRRDVSERYVIRVIDERSVPVHDAEVTIKQGSRELFSGRTDAGGQIYFFPRALENRGQGQASEFQVIATKGYVAQSMTFPRNGGDLWIMPLNNPPHNGYTQLDLLFLIDATGSMGDEIDKLKVSMADVANQIANLPEQPDTRYGLVAYRDQGDQFVVRTHDFTANLDRFQRDLANVYADGGGDTPEALNEALHRSLNDLSWRGEDTVRLIILVADAPPHLDYRWEPFSYDQEMFNAVQRGIKIFPVGASNLEADGEYIFRQLAQVTGGKFVFLTYKEGSDPSSGPGAESDHEVENYSVDTLDRLVVRLVREELAKLGSMVHVVQQPQQVPTLVPTATPAPQPMACTIDFQSNWSDCGQGVAIQVLDRAYNSALLGLSLGESGYTRARFDVTFGSAPRGSSFNIGDALTGSYGDASAEAVISDGSLLVYGNAYTPAGETSDGKRLLRQLSDVARSGETISVEIANQRLGINYASGIDVVDSHYLFTLDREGNQPNLYAAFNRTINGAGSGAGVSKVVVTLYPER